MKKYTSNDIIQILSKDITLGKYSANEKLPSEGQLSIKYNISRAITGKVFSSLKEMDLAYSVPHQGYFVSEWFAGITKPYNFTYNIDKVTYEETPNKSKSLEDFSHEHNLNFNGKTFLKKLIDNKEIIIIEELFISKYLNEQKWFTPKKALDDLLIKEGKLQSVVKFTRFEADDSFQEKMQIIEYKIYYGDQKILGVSRAIIKHSKYKSIKRERPV